MYTDHRWYNLSDPELTITIELEGQFTLKYRRAHIEDYKRKERKYLLKRHNSEFEDGVDLII